VVVVAVVVIVVVIRVTWVVMTVAIM